MPNDFNQAVIDEFRANSGRVGGYFAEGRLLLLTTTGRRTGARHTTPVAYLPDGGRVLVIASAGGAPRHPAWFHNLVAHPRVTVEDGVFTYPATAAVLEGAERHTLFARAAEADPGWAAYEEKSGRLLPVVALCPEGGPPHTTAATPGEALLGVHDAFRRELSLIRAEVARSGAAIGAQLRVNCLTLCQGLEYHHKGEDTMLFPPIAADHPRLAATFERLRTEHTAIAALLADLRATLDGATPPERLLPEVDRLIADLESHLAYEEEHLIPVLDAG
ncbi:MAG TPA: nitroreductase/quinone reductase family protein [Streptosporangiaceae bacterium]|jgi:deazaflavin-dependent oxidoreductase (nitroreductase family)